MKDECIEADSKNRQGRLASQGLGIPVVHSGFAKHLNLLSRWLVHFVGGLLSGDAKFKLEILVER